MRSLTIVAATTLVLLAITPQGAESAPALRQYYGGDVRTGPTAANDREALGLDALPPLDGDSTTQNGITTRKDGSLHIPNTIRNQHPELKNYNAEDKTNHHSTFVMMEVTHDGQITVKAAKHTHQKVSACRTHPVVSDNQVVVSYTHPVSKKKCVVVQKDPRKMYYDHNMGSKKGKMKGGIHQHKKIEFAVNVHKEVSDFQTIDHRYAHLPAKNHTLTESHHRAYETMAAVTIDANLVEASTLQHVGPTDQQKNFVFISAGYKDTEKTTFEADVQTLINFVQTPDTSSLSSQPYRRYFSAMNFYQVWYPSSGSGASHPMSGVEVNNNLDCTYGDTTERILTCDRNKVMLAGSYAPPSASETIYVILVNDPNTFGGTGGSGVCTTYTGDDMKVIFIHEIGHAGADLSDEYDYGYSESNQIEMKNCHYESTNTPWEAWVVSAIIPPPTSVCTYTNYWKPTPSSCLMESDQPSYCPVCSASTLEQMYDAGMNLASPRYPGIYETVFVGLGESVALYMNNKIPYHKDETGLFTVGWSVVDYPAYTASGTHTFGVYPAANGTSAFVYPGVGNYTVNVTISDDTNMLLSGTRATLTDRNGNNATALKQIHSFRVVVYDPATSEYGTKCTNKTDPYGTTYCAICDGGFDAECNGTTTTVPLTSVIAEDTALEGLQGWLVGIGGMFVALGILIFILIWRMMALHAEHNPREILTLTTGIVIIRVVLLGVQIGLLIGSTMSIMFSVYMYGQLSVFGRTLMLGVIASSVVVWFASFVGFCAAYYKNRAVLFVNFILLLLLFGCALLFTTLILYMLFNIDQDSVKEQLDGEWRTAVSSDSVQVCTLQSHLKCSGFNTSCVTVAYNTAGTSNCPSNCETYNQYGDPCFLRVREFVKSKFATASIGGVILCVFIVTAMSLALILGCSIKSRRNRVHKDRRQRHQNGEPTLTPEEIAMLRREFDKIDKDGSGDISRQEFALFYNAVMGVQLSPRELEEYFDKLDADGNGVLSFEEFVQVYVPQTETKKKSLAKTKSMIYARTQERSMMGDSLSQGGTSMHGGSTHGSIYGTGSVHSQGQKSQQGPSGGTVKAVADVPTYDEEEGDVEYDEDEEEEGAPANGNGTGYMLASVKSQAAMTKGVNMNVDGDMDEEMTPEEEARQKEENQRQEAAKVAQAETDRQNRLQEDRAANVDADLVNDDDDSGAIGGFGGGTLETGGGAEGGGANLDIDLDNEEFE